ncbi:MAG: N-acetylmuramoyl-L-alanine amidase [Anaerolineae bacterium]|nr:N-acetylmuramoyl-L-alanine amidase [Anaerolineae bacterium]
MPDAPRFEDDNQEPEVPASVTFMEMMRQAANRATADAEASAEVPPAEPDNPPSASDAPPAPAESPVELRRKHAAALETQRIQRVQRRRARRRTRAVGTLGGMFRSFVVVAVAAGLMATIFVWWTPAQFISADVRSELSQVQAPRQAAPLPTIQPTPNWLRKIGIVAGHRGPELDPGAVCPDGLTEGDINFNIAQLVVRGLRAQGFSVDLLDEFDPRLENYQAAALVSIHSNTCQNFGETVSGYLVAAAAARVTARGDDEVLVDCLARYYQQETGLERHSGLTDDMTNYHTFREIHPLTPAVIIELGFLLADRDLLTKTPELPAEGVANGILCFLQPAQAPPLETPLAAES